MSGLVSAAYLTLAIGGAWLWFNFKGLTPNQQRFRLMEWGAWNVFVESVKKPRSSILDKLLNPWFTSFTLMCWLISKGYFIGAGVLGISGVASYVFSALFGKAMEPLCKQFGLID